MDERERKTVAAILREQLELKGLTAEKLSEQTGIAERHLTALLKGEIQKLPAAPYVRGYLTSVCRILGLDASELWKTYRHELEIKHSGPSDRLPSNRYAIRKVGRRGPIVAVVLVLLVIYAGVNASRLIGKPNLQITNPSVETTVVAQDLIVLTGNANPRDKLLIDSQEVAIREDGAFEKAYPLQPGLNTIEFSAKRLLGKEVKIVRQVIYQP